MHPDGSGLEQLTHYESKDLRATQPRYSPDGDRILFTTVTSSSRSLSVISAEGGEAIMIAPGGSTRTATWQPG
jgi:Tol biopolymer transport system component